MFVLALTILGLSLFSLSSYEAQFMGRSTDEGQAFYYATGGIERAKYILAAKNKLSAVTNGLPIEGVETAEARWADGAVQDDITQTDWMNEREVVLRVEGAFHGTRKAVEGHFKLYRPMDIYERAITTSSGVYVEPNPDNTHGAALATYVTGECWQNSPDTWRGAVPTEHPGIYGVKVGYAPTPQAAPYIASWAPTATATSAVHGTSSFSLHAGGAPYKHFLGPVAVGGPGGDEFGYFNTASSVTINVDGTVLWMFDRGVRFEHFVEVTGGTNDVLIIVAEKSTAAFTPFPGATGFPDAGIWFAGGLRSAQVPVILVTDGTLALDHLTNDPTPDNEHFYYLTLFGGAIYLKGPPGNHQQRVCHHPGQGTSPANLDEYVLDPLYENGLLPNVSGSRNGTLTLVPGTWREVTEDLTN